MTIRRKVIDRQWTIVVHRRVKRQHQRWTLPYDPHASVAMTMDPAFVAFGTFEPALQVSSVDQQLRPRIPPPTPVHSRSSSWHNAAQRDPRWTPTPAAARCTAPHARPSWPWRSASGDHPLLGGLGRRGQRAPRHPVRQPVRDPYTRPGVSTTPLQAPWLGVQVALQRVASIL
jgi:hypothetical protein